MSKTIERICCNNHKENGIVNRRWMCSWACKSEGRRDSIDHCYCLGCLIKACTSDDKSFLKLLATYRRDNDMTYVNASAISIFLGCYPHISKEKLKEIQKIAILGEMLNE